MFLRKSTRRQQRYVQNNHSNHPIKKKSRRSVENPKKRSHRILLERQTKGTKTTCIASHCDNGSRNRRSRKSSRAFSPDSIGALRIRKNNARIVTKSPLLLQKMLNRETREVRVSRTFQKVPATDSIVKFRSAIGRKWERK